MNTICDNCSFCQLTRSNIKEAECSTIQVEYFCGVKLKSVEGVFECSELESKCVEVPDESTEEVDLSECVNIDKHMKKTIDLLDKLIGMKQLYDKDKIHSMAAAQIELISVFGHADIKRT